MKTAMSLKTAAAVAAMAAAGILIAPGAQADRIKNCGTTTTEAEPTPKSNSGFTQKQTETQIASCNSNSDTGEVITPGPVTNRGGGTPKGQQ